ncbi:hypothetical protein [Bacteroides sp.]
MFKQIVFSKNNLFFIFLIWGYIFNVILYDYIDFTSADEIMALFLLFFAGLIINERRNLHETLPLCIVVGIFLFYAVYSLFIKSNTYYAILKDLLIQIKPFLGFYCTYLLAPSFSTVQKRFIVIMCITVGLIFALLGFTGNIYEYFPHPSYYAKSVTATVFLYLYCCTDKREDMIIFLTLLTVGLFSTRSKFIGFWGVSVLLVFLYKMQIELKFNLKGILLLAFLAALAIWLAKDKIALYYLNEISSEHTEWSRAAIMVTSVEILRDYFPLGSGLASFASFVSGEYYSSIYEKYGLNNIWGISRSNYDFVADAYYPVLAQFGIIGIGLYIYFWIWLLKKAQLLKRIDCSKDFLLIVLSTIFFAIEGIADATFSQNRGFFILVVTAMALAKTRNTCLVKEIKKKNS